jgi:hypothetical protein
LILRGPLALLIQPAFCAFFHSRQYCVIGRAL